MATIDQENAEKQELFSLLDELRNIVPEELIRNEELGNQLNFSSGLPFFTRILKLYKDLAESNLDNVPFQELRNIKELAKEAKTFFDNVKNFSPTNSNPSTTRDSYINIIRDNYDKHFSGIAPIIAYSIRKGTDFEKLENEARETLIQAKAIAKELENIQINTENESESILNKIRQAAAEVGVAQHATHFREEADYYSRNSKIWLAVTALLGVITIFWGIFYFKFHAVPVSDPPKVIELIESFASKLIILSVLYYLLVWSARNFAAHRHNFVINKHRQNALSTFETFVKAAGNDLDTKNAVLIQATQSIFCSLSSGYISSNDNEQESPNKLIEIIRNVGAMSK